jgi:hypothetical protein
MTPVENLPLVSMTLANFATSFASVVDTSGKVATGVNYTGGKFGAQPVSLTPAVHLSLRISPQIFLMGYSRAGGKLIHEKTL